MSEHLSSTGTRKPTSFFAGSTRWMAPELVHAQAEDKKIHVTTYSDVYAYGAVFLEVITGQLPYPHRSSDFLVILDIIQGVRPYQRSMVSAQMSALSLRGSAGSTSSVDVIWSVVESCWDPLPVVRPKMKDVVKLLVDLQVPPRCQV
ncbi:hypothetical protein E1B28_012783 [Marasmius oreades]|uniref:Protein kinase domain-containing protein n=1 Tax=Marasmius oreades TaxID=181124 RepID=A0A9P7RTL5_9AGAR|nr:uncharacterized protein E1B28_012783 [Marasmius oreades]KAG7088828.1 hypothetical protein E1B28_012783 [Marasmius oreades]